MKPFEDDLTARLGDLADDLTAGAPPSARAAVQRHRRTRRTRIGVAATALAVTLVAVGIPVGLSAVSAPAGDVAGEPVTPTGSTDPPLSPPTTSTTGATPTGAAWQARLDEAASLAARLVGPIDPSVPDPFSSCPDLAGPISTRLGVEIAPDGGEGNTTEPQSGMCLWATPDTVAETSDPSTWFGSTIRFLPDVGVADVRDRLFVCDQAGPCPTVDAPTAGNGAFLVTDLATDFQSLDLVVPDASGAGIWVIDAYRGTGYQGPSLLDGLNATAQELAAAYGTP